MNVNEVVKNGMYLLCCLQYKILDKISVRLGMEYIKTSCMAHEKYSDFYISYKVRPKYVENRILSNKKIADTLSDVAILIQGPIFENNDFTLQTVFLYRKMYPYVPIILSTWILKNEEIRRKLKKINIILIENIPPKISGMGNINLQVKSTYEGLKFAKNNIGVKYVLKTRTDQRIGLLNFLEYFYSLVENYPCKYGYLKQDCRIIALSASVGGNMFIPYFVSDFLFFGNCDDLINYFSIKEDIKFNFKDKKERHKYIDSLMDTNISLYDYYKITAPEVQLFINYINNNRKEKCKNTIKDYWEILENSFLMISCSDIDLFWAKDRHFVENELYNLFHYKDNAKLIYAYAWNFPMWLSLYKGYIKYNFIYESIPKQYVKDVKQYF